MEKTYTSEVYVTSKNLFKAENGPKLADPGKVEHSENIIMQFENEVGPGMLQSDVQQTCVLKNAKQLRQN